MLSRLMMNGFIDLICPRCKKTLEKNHPWQECYECIRTIYPET